MMACSGLVRLGAVAVALAAGSAHADVRTPADTAASGPIDPTREAPRPTGRAVGVPTPRETASPIDPGRAPELVSAPRTPDAVLDDRVHAGRHWRLETARGVVHVWVPAGYDAATAATVVFVHGYWIDVDQAWASYRLAQQFALSGINAIFVAPEAPSAKWEPLAWPSLTDLIRTVADRIDVAIPAQRLVAVGHSGAYRTLASWLADPMLDTVVQLDALYVEYGLLPWLRASTLHRLVNIVYETGRFSNYLHRRLPSTRRVDGLPLGGLPDARILYVRTDVGHWELVTDGVALPLALRAIGVPSVASAPLDLPLGLPPPCDGSPPPISWLARPGFPPRFTELAP